MLYLSTFFFTYIIYLNLNYIFEFINIFFDFHKIQMHRPDKYGKEKHE